MKQIIKVIGITGGIASGKSTIAEILRSLGANVIDADKLCHQLINTKEITQRITEKWGNRILNQYGKIKRDALAKIVFSDKKEISALNKIIHPEAIRLIKSRIAELKNESSTKAIVLDAALLVESNLKDICDVIIFVDTKLNTRKKRALISRKWSSDQLDERESYQGLLREKREMADIIINNNQSETDTINQVEDFWCHFITNM